MSWAVLGDASDIKSIIRVRKCPKTLASDTVDRSWRGKDISVSKDRPQPFVYSVIVCEHCVFAYLCVELRRSLSGNGRMTRA